MPRLFGKGRDRATPHLRPEVFAKTSVRPSVALLLSFMACDIEEAKPFLGVENCPEHSKVVQPRFPHNRSQDPRALPHSAHRKPFGELLGGQVSVLICSA